MERGLSFQQRVLEEIEHLDGKKKELSLIPTDDIQVNLKYIIGINVTL